MLLLVVEPSADVVDALEGLSIDDATLRASAPEGLDIDTLPGAGGSTDYLKALAANGRHADIVVVDGAEPFITAAGVAESSPDSRLVVVMPPSGTGCPALCPSAIVVKRPLLVGELDGLVENLVRLCGLHRSFKGIFNTSSSLMALVSSAGVVAAWNDAAARFTGTPPEKALGLRIWDLLPLLKGHEQLLASAFQSASTTRLNRISPSTPGQEDRYFDAFFMPLASCDEALIRIDEVSDDVKKDEHLRQAQKMDSVGSLAAGLAHDFNNVIGGIEATMSSIRFSLENTQGADALLREMQGDFELVDESVKRGKGIVEQLMALSRRQEKPLSLADLNFSLSNIANICKNTFPRDVKMEFNPWTGGEAAVLAYPTQLEQAFLNLCINGCHAMTIMRKEGEERSGTLSMSITKIEVGSNITSVMPEAVEGQYWLVSISDTGVGMSREVMQRIFEPFFTTKEKGKGTGLGLAMVYNIIRQHKGFMDIYSEPGAGSTFLVFLPAHDEPPHLAGEAKPGA